MLDEDEESDDEEEKEYGSESFIDEDSPGHYMSSSSS